VAGGPWPIDIVVSPGGLAGGTAGGGEGMPETGVGVTLRWTKALAIAARISGV
jgi:hypothetical protein